jgi:hypothetical protein
VDSQQHNNLLTPHSNYQLSGGTDVESMAIKRYRRGKYVVVTEKSLFSISAPTGGEIQRLWSNAQTPDSVCTARRIGYNYCESPAMVAGAMT